MIRWGFYQCDGSSRAGPAKTPAIFKPFLFSAHCGLFTPSTCIFLPKGFHWRAVTELKSSPHPVLTGDCVQIPVSPFFICAMTPEQIAYSIFWVPCRDSANYWELAEMGLFFSIQLVWGIGPKSDSGMPKSHSISLEWKITLLIQFWNPQGHLPWLPVLN